MCDNYFVTVMVKVTNTPVIVHTLKKKSTYVNCSYKQGSE
jgi:hypothetical protein